MEEPGAQLVRTAPPTTPPRVKGTRRPKKRRVGYAISDGDGDDLDDDDDDDDGGGGGGDLDDDDDGEEEEDDVHFYSA